MRNKKLLISLIVAALIIILIIFLLVYFKQKNSSQLTEEEKQPLGPAFKVEFLSDAEKIKAQIPVENKIQVGSRDPLVYKVIRSDADIVTSSSELGPISPRTKK